MNPTKEQFLKVATRVLHVSESQLLDELSTMVKGSTIADTKKLVASVVSGLEPDDVYIAARYHAYDLLLPDLEKAAAYQGSFTTLGKELLEHQRDEKSDVHILARKLINRKTITNPSLIQRAIKELDQSVKDVPNYLYLVLNELLVEAEQYVSQDAIQDAVQKKSSVSPAVENKLKAIENDVMRFIRDFREDKLSDDSWTDMEIHNLQQEGEDILASITRITERLDDNLFNDETLTEEEHMNYLNDIENFKDLVSQRLLELNALDV